ncbi:hypothetical protein [Pseudomonas sp. DC3200b2]|uniref:hypothetical protein n=1 Tax=Pseudomonas sp. DC3200b2 TaxID=2804669 RepID=UPI003CF99BBE
MRISLVTLGLTFWAAVAQAAPPLPGYQAQPSVNPLNSPIRRINPNSRQGTVPSAPAQRDAWQALPNRPMPSLENRGIGNGQAFPRPAPGAPPRPPAQRRP